MRKDDEEIRRKKKELLNRFEDERDHFLYELPLLAPTDFKPLKKHRPLCKICYDNKIDSIMVPCAHSLFCVDCSHLLKENCPTCGVKILKVVKIFDLKNYAKNVR